MVWELLAFGDMLAWASLRLTYEIKAQEQLLVAENGRLDLNVGPISTTDLLTELVALYNPHAESLECTILGAESGLHAAPRTAASLQTFIFNQGYEARFGHIQYASVERALFRWQGVVCF